MQFEAWAALACRTHDEAVRGGVYFYGSLHACPKSGSGHWKPSLQGENDEQTQRFCSLGIISVLKVTKVLAGPKAAKNAQWAICGSEPNCAYVIGSIVTKPFNDAVNAMGLWQDENQFGDFVKGMLDVLATPPNYLDPDKLLFY